MNSSALPPAGMDGPPAPLTRRSHSSLAPSSGGPNALPRARGCTRPILTSEELWLTIVIS